MAGSSSRVHDRAEWLTHQQRVLVELALTVTREHLDLSVPLMAVTEAAARVLDVARVNIWMYNEDRSQIRCIDHFAAAEGTHAQGQVLEAREFPGYFAALEEQRTIAAGHVLSDPRTRELVEPYLRPLSISSLLDAPLRLQGRMVGVICHEHIGAPRDWSPEEQAMAGSLADLICLAIESHERWLAQQQLQTLNDTLEERVRERTAAAEARTQELAVSEAALRAQSQLLQSILNSMGEGVVVVDDDARFLQFNPAAERMIGIGPTDARVADWTRRYGLYLEDQQTPFPTDQLPLARAMRGEAVDDALLFVRNEELPEGVWLSVSARPLVEDGERPRGAVAILRDVTRQRHADEEIRRLNAELEQRVRQRTSELAAANRELEAFCYSVSHDLRAPLRSIDGFSLVLLEDCAEKLDEQGRDYLRRVRDAAQRMGRLIDAMLDLSRMTRNEMRRQRVDLSLIARQVADELDRREPGRKVEWRIAPDLSAHGDPDLLRVVLTNLLDNAWKFTARQSPAQIEFGSTGGPRPEFYVSDNGVGFDMKYVGRLYRAFNRLHGEDFPGIGIGLATVQRILLRHGGQIRAEGRPGGGATFYFTV